MKFTQAVILRLRVIVRLLDGFSANRSTSTRTKRASRRKASRQR